MATVQLSVETRNNIAEAIELSINGQTLSAGTGSGASVTGAAAPPKCQIWSGALPANTAAAPTGTKIAEITCPADWAAAAASGAKGLAGTWTVTAVAAGNPGYYRMVDSTGKCHEQGDITAAGGGGAMTVDNTSVALGQTFAVLSKTVSIPHA